MTPRSKPEEPVTQRLECDLVMKGGITSGVVYPTAILRLAAKYDFRSIGGTSAGAIAAAATAAAQYGRASGGMEKLAELGKELGEDGVLRGLFEPQPEMKPLMTAI